MQAMKFLCKTILCTLFVMMLASCDEHVAMTSFRAISQDGWEREDTIHVPLDSVKASGDYVLTLHLRLSSAPRYPFTDISLQLTQCLHSDTITKALQFPLTTGRSDMAGKGVSLYVYDFPIDTIPLNTGEKGLFIIKHDMRLTPLPGVHDVGLSLRQL